MDCHALPEWSGRKPAYGPVTRNEGGHTIHASVVDDDVDRNATTRTDERQRCQRGKGSRMDPYTATKMIEYNQQELARMSGKRNWVNLFRR